jgi:hypothetical protein
MAALSPAGPEIQATTSLRIRQKHPKQNGRSRQIAPA